MVLALESKCFIFSQVESACPTFTRRGRLIRQFSIGKGKILFLSSPLESVACKNSNDVDSKLYCPRKHMNHDCREGTLDETN